MKLREYLENTTVDSMSLYHNDEEIEEFTLVEFNIKSFTEQGLEDWAEVLNAEVVKEQLEEYSVAIWVDGVSAELVEALQAAHA